MIELETFFEPFRRNTIGHDQTFVSPYGEHRIVYADWTASGRLYRPIEDRLRDQFGPFVGNTHSESSVTGTAMTQAYTEAKRILKAREGRAATGQPILPRVDRIRYETAAADLRQHYRVSGERDPEEAEYRLAHLDAFFANRQLASIGPADSTA